MTHESSKNHSHTNYNGLDYIQEIVAIQHGERFPSAVAFADYDVAAGIRIEIIVHWTKALQYLREHPAASVNRVFWADKDPMGGVRPNDFGNNGWTYAAWKGYDFGRGMLYQIQGICGGSAFLREVEVRAVPGKEVA